MNLIDLNFIYFGNGFGINTDILETNVINLSVVVVIVITFIGDALKELLNNRKKKILQNICAADARSQEIKNQMDNVVSQLEKSKKQANQILEQGILAVEREKKACIEEANEEIARLKKTKKSAIQLQQQKAIQEISQKIVKLSLEEVKSKLLIKMKSSTFHPWVNKLKISKYILIKEKMLKV